MSQVIAPTAIALSAVANQDIGGLVTFTADNTASTTSSPQANVNCCGVKVIIDITAITGTSPTLQVTIRGRDNKSGKAYTLLASASLNATGTTVLTVYPTGTSVANLYANDHLPAVWDVICTIGGTTPAVTATVSACLIV